MTGTYPEPEAEKRRVSLLEQEAPATFVTDAGLDISRANLDAADNGTALNEVGLPSLSNSRTAGPGGNRTGCPADTESSSVEDPLLHMELLGKIEIRSLIGTGNRGRVYKAWHRELQLEVAVKFLHEHFVDSPEKIARFKSEAKIASSISHAAIVKIYDYGFTPTGQPFIIMEHVPDGTLKEVLDSPSRPTTLPAFCTFFEQVAHALAHAHALGILHRDLKPENILVQKGEDGRLTPKIGDWGIAKVVFSNELSPQFTATGDVLGSPPYMSPEQCQGQAVSGASDIYSIGCVMYEWLTGKLAFTGRNAFDCMRKHLEETSQPISTFRKDTPPVLERLVSLCLEKDPECRPRNAAVLKELLVKIEKGQHGEALKIIERQRPPLEPPTGKITQLVIASCALILMALLGFSFYQNSSGELGGGSSATMPTPITPPVSETPVTNSGAPMSTPLRADLSTTVAPNSFSFTPMLKDFIYDFNLAASYYQALGNAAAATQAQHEADKATQLYNSQRLQKTSQPLLHLVSFDSGEPLKKFDPRGTANVRVSCTDSPVILALAAPAEIHWNLKVDPGVRLEKIILIGSQKHTLTGAPAGVTVIKMKDEKNDLGLIEAVRAVGLDKSSKALRELAKANLSTWQSESCAGKKWWIVGPESPDWLAQRIIGLIQTPHERVLNDMSGQFLLSVQPGGLNVSVPRSINEFNTSCQDKFGSIVFPATIKKLLPFAPPSTFAPAPPSAPQGFQCNGNNTITHVTELNRFFYADYDKLVEIDPKTTKTDTLDLPPEGDYGYMERALAVDWTGRNLLLKDVHSLFRLSLADNTWTKISDLLPPPGDNRKILAGLTYSPYHKSIYTLQDKLPGSHAGFRFLWKISTTGRLIKKITLSRRVGADFPGQNPTIVLLPCGPYVMAIATTTTPGKTGIQAICYAINPLNGQVLLIGPVKPDNIGWKQ